MIILGLNAYHADAAACLLRDGTIVAAAEEERFRRVKHWAGLPVEAVRWCLVAGRVGLHEVDVIAVNRDPRANMGRRICYALRHRPQLRLVADRLRNLSRIESLPVRLERALAERNGGPAMRRAFGGTLQRVEHHLAHQASAFIVSPWEEAALLSVDGFGDFAGASWGMGRGTRIELTGRIYFPHSLGVFYLTLTQYLGFPWYGDEYKVMALAPYGRPRFREHMRELVRIEADGTFRLGLDHFRHHREHLEYCWEHGAPTLEPHFTPALEELLGPARRPEEPLSQRHRDIACSLQERFEEALFALLERVHREQSLPAVVLSGGAAMNSVANGRVARRTPFRHVFLPPAPGDAGGAIGAALVAWHRNGAARRDGPWVHSYLGPRFGLQACRRAVQERCPELEAAGARLEQAEDDAVLCDRVARAIADGAVVGWFQDAMEFGPRALGNRSILADPRRPEIRELLNERVKLRESFRPFGPSILREAMGEWFTTDDDVPFMMQVHELRPEKRHLVPAVTHVDGTGRPHTVTREANPLYYALIRRFAELSGVPMLLNTSFNENEPIVRTPAEGLDSFLRTRMDLLVLGRLILRRD